ncbi:MAG: hypothetical protein IT383_26265 [Deltaproteobacteria bacterium]|nr:hypothetical protein [Deltaproteobacteria bacterium]
MNARLWRSTVLAAAAAAALWGCVSQRHGISRDALEASLRTPPASLSLPPHEAVLALRYPAPGSDGADAMPSPCLVASSQRAFDEVIERCVEVIEQDPAAPRAFAAARVLERTASGVVEASAVIAARGPRWLDDCRRRRGRCADLAWLIADERLERATIARDDAGVVAAVAASGRLTHANVEGPFAVDARTAYAMDGSGTELPRHRTAWRVTEAMSRGGFFSPGGTGIGGVYRLRFAASAGGRANLIVTGAHALRVRVDRKVVVERTPDQRTGDVLRASLDLTPGEHAIELLAQSLGANDRISFALLDDAGAPVATASTGTQGGAGVAVSAARGAVEALALNVASATLDELLWRAAVVRSPVLAPNPDEAQVIARALVARFGRSPVALATAAEIVGEEAGVPARVSSSAADALWAQVLEQWPEHPVARITAARRARDERPDEALAAYRRLVKERPRYVFGLREAIGLLLDAGAIDEANEIAEHLLELEPSAENIDAAIPAVSAVGDQARAAELEARRAALDGTSSWRRAARRALDGLHSDEGAALLGQAVARDPLGPASAELVSLLALSDPWSALAVANDAVAAQPGDGALAVRRAELVGALRGAAAGREALVASLPLVRDSDAAARAAERMGLVQPWAWRLPLAGETLRRRRAAPERFREHAAVALLDDVERWYFEDLSSLVIRHLIIELGAKEVLDRFGELGLGDARAIRARVHKPDGSWAEAERHTGVDDVSLPQLAVGDVVELLTVERHEPVLLPGSFETRALDGLATPALQRRYLVSFPLGLDEALHFTLIAEHGLPAPQRERFVDGEGRARTRLTFTVDDVAAAPDEPFAPDSSETARTGGVSWGMSDELWAVLRGVPVERAARADAWLVDAARVIAGAGDDEDRLARLFGYVARRVEPASSPTDAVGALVLGQGGRTALLLALCRAAGLDAAPVALQLVGQLDPDVPDGNAWRVSAVRVRTKVREHYAIVDGNTVLDRLPPSARGAWVLDLDARARGPRRSRLPDSAIDPDPVRLEGSLAVEQRAGAWQLGGVVVLTLPAADADSVRRGLRRATPEQVRALLEGALSPSLPGVTVTDVRTPALDADGEGLRIGVELGVPLDVADDGTVRFEHLFAQGIGAVLGTAPPPTAYLRVPERTRPLVLQEDRELLEIEITLPRGALFVETPARLQLGAGPVRCEQLVEVTDGRLRWRREIHRENARVAVEQWPGAASAIAALSAKLDARLGFVLPPQAQGPK